MEIAVRDSGSGREILASGQGLYQAEASREASFTIETLGHSAREFDVVVSGPGGIAVPVRCYQQKDGNLLAQFTPPAAGMQFYWMQMKAPEQCILFYLPGSYKVEVLHGAKPLRSSPFFCQAFDSSRVRITGLGSKAVAVHDPISFNGKQTIITFLYMLKTFFITSWEGFHYKENVSNAG
jgi:filamin